MGFAKKAFMPGKSKGSKELGGFVKLNIKIWAVLYAAQDIRINDRQYYQEGNDKGQVAGGRGPGRLAVSPSRRWTGHRPGG